MADWREETRRAAQRYGLDPSIFERQIQQESGFNPNARSPAGALGIAQIMPATARGWGVDPMNPRAALNAAAKNMARYVDQYGSYRNALIAYNAGPGRVGKPLYAETANYIKTILNGKSPPARTSRPAPAAVAGPSTDPASGLTVSAGDGPRMDATALIQLASNRERRPSSSALPTPAAMAGPALPDRYQALAATRGPARRQDVGALIAAATTPGAVGGVTQSPPPADAGALPASSGAPKGSGGIVPLGGSKNAGKGAFQISGPQPDRLQPGLTSFAKKVAAVYGGTLTGADGSSHSKYTVNGNVSEHYTGNATDVFKINGKPAVGERLIRAGQAALIAAGADRKWALKQRGGLYNIGNHQIIFHTSGAANGGNHMDHLHISTHARR